MELHPTANAVRFRCGNKQSGVVRIIPQTIRFNRQEAEYFVTYVDSELFDRQSPVGEMLLHSVDDGALKVELLRDNIVLDSSDYVMRYINGRPCNARWQETEEGKEEGKVK